MSALLRALLGLLVETALWVGLVIAVAAVVAVVVMALFASTRDPRPVVALATIGAALAVGVAHRAGLPPLWQVGMSVRQVSVVWSAVGAVVVATWVCADGSGRLNRARGAGRGSAG